MDEQQPKSSKQPPKCIAIVVCNEIIEDKRTNNKTLVSLFNGIVAQEVPFIHDRMFIMASLTGGGGKWPIIFRLLSPSHQEVLRVEGEEIFDDPRAVRDIVIELRGVPFQEEGVYFIDFLAGMEPLAERRFAVQRVKRE